MASSKVTQLLSDVLAAADGGGVDKSLSRGWNDLISDLTTAASFHEADQAGEFTIKIKIKAEQNGDVAIAFGKTAKRPAEKAKVAKFHVTADGTLETGGGRQRTIPGTEDEPVKRRTAKGADAPTG